MNKATPAQCLSAGARFATFLGSIGATEEVVSAFNKANAGHPFYDAIAEHFAPKPVVVIPYSEEVFKAFDDWKAFYQKFFGIELDVTGIKIPAHVEGFDRLVIIAKGVRLNRVWNVHEERNIPRYQWWNGALENAMQVSERGEVKETYAFWVRNVVEADEDMKNISAETIAERKLDTENLIERLVHGLKFFDETGNHLDVKNVTLCASSRFAGGDVPRVYRLAGGSVDVYGCVVGRFSPRLRARRAVR